MSLLWHFSQAWLPEPEPGFRPGSARIDWDATSVRIIADLASDKAGSGASADGERLWELGDVLEVFIGDADGGYREYQIAPNGFMLSLRYPDLSCVGGVRGGSRRLGEFFTERPLEAGATVTPEGWHAMLVIPRPLPATTQGKGCFRLSCCRYDYGTGGPPVLSSTSPHPVRDFHRPQDWREIPPVEE
jgi:hypothetical protein